MTVCIVWTHSGHVDLIFIRSTTLLARHIQWDGRGSESATFRNIQRRIDTIVGYTLRRSYFTRKGSRVGIGSKLCQGKHRRGQFFRSAKYGKSFGTGIQRAPDYLQFTTTCVLIES